MKVFSSLGSLKNSRWRFLKTPNGGHTKTAREKLQLSALSPLDERFGPPKKVATRKGIPLRKSSLVNYYNLSRFIVHCMYNLRFAKILGTKWVNVIYSFVCREPVFTTDHANTSKELYLRCFYFSIRKLKRLLSRWRDIQHHHRGRDFSRVYSKDARSIQSPDTWFLLSPTEISSVWTSENLKDL